MAKDTQGNVCQEKHPRPGVTWSSASFLKGMMGMNLIVHSGDAEMEGERSRCENDGMGMVNSTLKKSVSITYPI